VSGILGECGGQAMCATCHVYVDAKDLGALPPMSDDEDAMLEDTASERKPSSRLSCQLDASDELDGLVVYLPDEQSLGACAVS
jgi:ferredoxin, 2Fe-2S